MKTMSRKKKPRTSPALVALRAALEAIAKAAAEGAELDTCEDCLDNKPHMFDNVQLTR